MRWLARLGLLLGKVDCTVLLKVFYIFQIEFTDLLDSRQVRCYFSKTSLSPSLIDTILINPWSFGFKLFLNHKTIPLFLFHLIPNPRPILIIDGILLMFLNFLIKMWFISNINRLMLYDSFLWFGLFYCHVGMLMIVYLL